MINIRFNTQTPALRLSYTDIVLNEVRHLIRGVNRNYIGQQNVTPELVEQLRHDYMDALQTLSHPLTVHIDVQVDPNDPTRINANITPLIPANSVELHLEV